ncbi:HEAT repeat domain-containing protein [Bradymonas sediminis]|uniref:Uncharacterized protein n=1 Tax=Bradymonas sediminis TaxID=1548548 RepID=A0A2Z4FGK5_9DELT|nr:HEAT repeat domain-containing protein [Bradymonas sediminis]AWV88083.1 hypothetical protein DN745_01535 [Bradymonas sediminis]TDP77206.1 tetratricopeptide repeat protein [Bradymonas sediminis]
MISALLSLKNHARARSYRTALALTSALLICSAGCDKPADTPAAPTPQSGAPAYEKIEAAGDKSAAKAEEDGDGQEKAEGPAIAGLAEATDSQQMLLLEAKKAFLTDDLTRAEALFETLVKSKPISGPQVSAVIALAQIYNETERPDKAVKLYDDLSDEVSALPEIQLVIARAYADLNEFERAIRAYRKLLKTQPDYVFAQLELGKIYAVTGNNDEAAKAFYAYEQQIYKLSARLESSKSTPEERLEVLSIFSLVSDERASAATQKALRAESPDVRRQAATVLGQMGAVEAIPALEGLTMNDPSPLVRMSAQQALKEIKELGLDPADATSGPTVVDDKNELPIK